MNDARRVVELLSDDQVQERLKKILAENEAHVAAREGSAFWGSIVARGVNEIEKARAIQSPREALTRIAEILQDRLKKSKNRVTRGWYNSAFEIIKVGSDEQKQLALAVSA